MNTMTDVKAPAAAQLYRIALGESDHTLTEFRVALGKHGLMPTHAPGAEAITPTDAATIAAAFRATVLPDLGEPGRTQARELLGRIER
jgi:hypothetical protein